MNRKSIAIVKKDSGLFGGIQNQLVKIIQGLVSYGYMVYLITDNDHSEFVSLEKKLVDIFTWLALLTGLNALSILVTSAKSITFQFCKAICLKKVLFANWLRCGMEI